MTETTRRRFVAGALTTGAVAALPGAAEAKKHRTKTKAATARARPTCASSAPGFAGLTAARDLVNAGKSVVVLEARDRRRRPRAEPRARRRQGVRARRHVRRPDPGPRARRWPRQLGVDTFDTYDTGEQRLHVRRPALDLQRHRPDGHRAAGPGDPARAHAGRAAARLDGDAACRSTRRGTRRARPTGTARRSRPGSRPTARRTSSAGSCRSRRARSSAPSRASCRCCSSSSTSPRRATRRTRARSSATSTRATARRCGASCGGSQQIALQIAPAARPARRARARRCAGSSRQDGARHGRPPTATRSTASA